MKKKVALLTLIVFLICCVNVYAAPASIAPADVVSTTSGILTITNPSTETISSYSKSHNISGYAASGAELSIYYLNNGTYYPLYKDGRPVISTVGASGMFINPINLSYGENNLLIRAELNGKVQYAKKVITILTFNLFNLFKGFNLF